MGEGTYSTRSVRLNAGDRLYLYSDGLTEAVNGDSKDFGKGRTLETFEANRAKPLATALAALRNAVEAWCSPNLPPDDVSTIAVEFSGQTGLSGHVDP